MSTLLVMMCISSCAFAGADTTQENTTIEYLPILSYDTDVGFGYGVKVFALNHLALNESFDFVLFNSTKGERWYRLVISYPDAEKRQGTLYACAIDVSFDYDKWIANSFFGIGNASRYDDKETYTREPLDIGIAMSHAFAFDVVGRVGVRYKAVRNYNFESASRLARLQPAINASRVGYLSVWLLLRYDTRNSYINPTRGTSISTEIEYVPRLTFNDVSFTRLGFLFQHYLELPLNRLVIAGRAGLQGLVGNELPVQVLLPVGGNNTLRGSPQDRFLDKVAGVANLELRFPIYWRFGGVAAMDAGKVWRRTNALDFRNWATNPTAGIRFSMDTFVVRFDVGFGKETTGLYFNFGHLF